MCPKTLWVGLNWIFHTNFQQSLYQTKKILWFFRTRSHENVMWSFNLHLMSHMDCRFGTAKICMRLCPLANYTFTSLQFFNLISIFILVFLGMSNYMVILQCHSTIWILNWFYPLAWIWIELKVWLYFDHQLARFISRIG